MSILITLHVLATVLWVGGMLFAHLALRPAALATLEPPLRLTLWANTFKGFFFWVWIAVITLLTTGLWIIFQYYQGMANAPLFIHIMFGSGLLMMLIYAWIFFTPYRGLKKAVAAEDWPEGGKHLNVIRGLVMANILLGLFTIVVATVGKYLI